MLKIETAIVIFLSVVLLVFSFYPIFYRYQTTPPGRVYVGTEFFTEDYAGYVSTINQGIKGNLTYRDKFTNEKLPATLLYFPYLILGRVGGMFGLNAIITYHLARLIFGVLYLYLTYKLISEFFPLQNKSAALKRLLTFGLILFTSSLPIIREGRLDSSALSYTTAEIEVFTRFFIQPHYLLGNLLLLFLLYLSIKIFSRHREDSLPQDNRGVAISKHKKIAALSFFARNDQYFSYAAIFFLSFFRPSNTLIFIVCIFLYSTYSFLSSRGCSTVIPIPLSGRGNCIIESTNAFARFFGFAALRSERQKEKCRPGVQNDKIKNIIIFLFGNILFALPGLLYLSILKKIYPFLPYFSYDVSRGNATSPIDFFLSFGLPFFFVLVGFILLMLNFSLERKISQRKIEEKVLFLYCYIFSIIICLFIIPDIIPFNSLRFIQTPTFIIVGLLSSFVIFSLIKNIYLLFALCILILAISLPTLVIDFRHQVKLYYDAYYIWPPKNYSEGFSYLEKNSNPQDVVLTYHSLANLVPMIAGNTVYWGHTNETLKYNEKKILVEKFYSALMSEEEAKKFISENNIKYILVGLEERGLGWKEYGFLKKVFENKEMVIYKFE